MYQQEIATQKFGVLRLVSAIAAYEADVGFPHNTSARIAIAIAAGEFDAGLQQVTAFFDWMQTQHQAFKLAVELEIQNHDLVWTAVWNSIMGQYWLDADDGFMAPYLSYERVAYQAGALHILVDTAGLHEDHKIRVTLDAAMQIRRCELQ